MNALAVEEMAQLHQESFDLLTASRHSAYCSAESETAKTHSLTQNLFVCCDHTEHQHGPYGIQLTFVKV